MQHCVRHGWDVEEPNGFRAQLTGAPVAVETARVGILRQQQSHDRFVVDKDSPVQRCLSVVRGWDHWSRDEPSGFLTALAAQHLVMGIGDVLVGGQGQELAHSFNLASRYGAVDEANTGSLAARIILNI